MRKYLLAGSALLLAGHAYAAHPNLVVNGGFEQTATGAPAQGFEDGPNWTYGQAVVGWTSDAGSSTNGHGAFNVLFPSATATTLSPDTRYTAAQVQTLASDHFVASPDGGNFMALDGDIGANGAFHQDIGGLTVGQKYVVQFDWAGTQFENRSGATTDYLQVGFGDQSKATPVFGGPTHYFEGWAHESFTFTADAVTETLSFLSIGTPTGLPPVALLDGVSVTAVPEPATWGLMLVGFGVLGAFARRRRQAAI